MKMIYKNQLKMITAISFLTSIGCYSAYFLIPVEKVCSSFINGSLKCVTIDNGPGYLVVGSMCLIFSIMAPLELRRFKNGEDKI